MSQVLGPKGQPHLNPLGNLESILALCESHAAVGPSPSSIKRPQKPLPRALTPAHMPPAGCPPGRRGAASLTSTASPSAGLLEGKPAVTSQASLGRAPGSPREAHALLFNWAAQGPAEGGPKAPMSPHGAHPAASASHPASDLKWALGMGSQLLGGDCNVLAGGDHGSPIESWTHGYLWCFSRHKRSCCLPAVLGEAGLGQPLLQARQTPAPGNDPFWKVRCVPGLSLRLQEHHLISSS